MNLQRMNLRSTSKPTIVDRRGEGVALPPFEVLGSGCWATEGNPVAWRLGVRLMFIDRPARRVIWRDEIGPTFDAAVERLAAWFGVSTISTIEIWHATRLRDLAAPTDETLAGAGQKSPPGTRGRRQI